MRPPVRVRLGEITRREAQRRAALLGISVQVAVEHWRPLANPGEHDPQGSVGFPPGSTPDESFANMIAFLKHADRQPQLMELGNHPTIRRGAIVPLATDHSTAAEVRGAPLQTTPDPRPLRIFSGLRNRVAVTGAKQTTRCLLCRYSDVRLPEVHQHFGNTLVSTSRHRFSSSLVSSGYLAKASEPDIAKPRK